MKFHIAKNQLAITAALETTKFNFSVSGKYVDAFRTLGDWNHSCKKKVPSNFIIDFQPDITSQNTSA
jgi:Fe(3+) dicitrate transport protein